MKTIRWARRRVANPRSENERGASLILALAFLSLFGVFIVALLGFATTAFLSTTGIHDQGLRQYAAQSAVDTAIQKVRDDVNLGRDPVFGGPACAFNYPAMDGGPAVSVACTGQAGSGDVQPGIDGPTNAILTLANSGVGIDDSKNGTLVVSGPIFSNSDIFLHQANPKLDATDMPVTARGNCGDSLGDWTYGDLRCNFAGSDPDGNDPNFTSRLGEVDLSTPNVPAPTCLGSGGNRVIVFEPGYYTNVALLEGPVSGCNNAPRWFKPGAYYFDFDFDPAFTDNTWAMSGVIVGGTPKGWTPGSSPPPTGSVPSEAPAASTMCQAPGVQFIFGGGSKIDVGANSTVELCPSLLGGPGGAIVMYGQKTGVASPVSVTRRAINATSVAPNPFAPTTNALPIAPNPSPIDDQWALATLPTSGTAPVATISMTGFPGAPAVPAGSVSVSLELTIVHRETYTNNNQIGMLQMKIGTCTINVPRGNSGVATPYTATSITDPCLTAATAGTFNVDYVVTGQVGRPQITSEIDGVELVASYTPPVARTLDNGGGNLVFIGGNTPIFYIWGTVYAPTAILNIDFKNKATVVFDRGVILNRLVVAAVPSADTRGSFRLGTGGRIAEFIATVDGTRRVRALVRFVDTSTPGRITRVQRWSVNH